ncbi:MAG: hypothetical protein ACJ8AS_07275 [Hyphomicrobiales bacterium]
MRLGLKENWRQFALLVLVNAFVGGMVGIERTVVPLIGAEEFGLTSTTFVVAFIVSFGIVKALANLVSGQLADSWGRKRVLVLGGCLACRGLVRRKRSAGPWHGDGLSEPYRRGVRSHRGSIWILRCDRRDRGAHVRFGRALLVALQRESIT